jgi:putative membrane protein
MATERPDDFPSVPPLRVTMGGLLMGLANIVPGVSGGTMILALGLYDHFIGAVARLTTLRWSPRLFGFFVVFGAALAVAIVGGAKVAVTLVAEQRWIMYSIFIGLTLGGVPELVGQCRPAKATVWIGAAAGFLIMAALAFVLDSAPVPQNTVTFLAIGALAASSMILPGISGSTILLIFGFYEVVIGSLSSDSLREDLIGSLMIAGPVAIGAGLGIAVLSNVLKLCLARYRLGSHGFLMGLLVGSLLVIVPFQQPTHPDLAFKDRRKAIEMVVEGRSAAEVEAERGVVLDAAEVERIRREYGERTPGELKRMSEELEYFRPTAVQVVMMVVLVAVGFLATQLIARLGKSGA